jgi:hypothetical protein
LGSVRYNICCRPLPEEYITYARCDTHYLLYIKDKLTTLLTQKNLLAETREKSQLTATRKWQPKSGSTNFRKSRNFFMAFRAFQKEKQIKFTLVEEHVTNQLFQLRESLGEQYDLNVNTVWSKWLLLDLVFYASRDCSPSPPSLEQLTHFLTQKLTSADPQSTSLLKINLTQIVQTTLEALIAPTPASATLLSSPPHTSANYPSHPLAEVSAETPPLPLCTSNINLMDSAPSTEDKKENRDKNNSQNHNEGTSNIYIYLLIYFIKIRDRFMLRRVFDTSHISRSGYFWSTRDRTVICRSPLHNFPHHHHYRNHVTMLHSTVTLKSPPENDNGKKLWKMYCKKCDKGVGSVFLNPSNSIHIIIL